MIKKLSKRQSIEVLLSIAEIWLREATNNHLEVSMTNPEAECTCEERIALILSACEAVHDIADELPGPSIDLVEVVANTGTDRVTDLDSRLIAFIRRMHGDKYAPPMSKSKSKSKSNTTLN